MWRSRSGADTEASLTPGIYRGFDLSPDDKYALVHIHEPRSAGGNLWLLDLARKVPSRFTEQPRHDTAPIWSPDGTRVVFTSTDAASAGLYVKDLKADSRPTLLLKFSGANAIARSWSADGRWIMLQQRAAGGNADLAVLPVSEPDRSVAVADSRFNEKYGDFSPDGPGSRTSRTNRAGPRSMSSRFRAATSACVSRSTAASSPVGAAMAGRCYYQPRRQADERSGDAFEEARDGSRDGTIPDSVWSGRR